MRDCPTAYECRDQLPALGAWMGDENLKLLPIWRGVRFAPNEVYFDLDHPERGPFAATGDERPIGDHTYTRHLDMPEQVWAQLITWRQSISTDQAEAIELSVQDIGIGREQSAAGEAHPLPPQD